MENTVNLKFTENINIEANIAEKSMGCTYKFTWYHLKALTYAFYPMAREANCLICIFMVINENLKNTLKTVRS